MSDPLLRTIFIEALDRPTAAERAAFLHQACGFDTALRERLELLLQAHEDAGAFLADSSKKPAGGADPARAEALGDRIGRYKLLQQIGEGGCGVVYMAEQEEPVRRRVALKVIKLGMDTRQVIARFDAERQALALMDHPNIARVLDAGSTEAGRPYFVMELIRGVKITDFCDEQKLSTEERLKLFIQVCQAIQHAHQKGVIHRDIKPSNVLVTVNDGVAVPKVIDFGIAKAAQGRLTDHTLFTAFEQFIGTPAYMSPEQAVMTSLDVDTRSDIYSLGVLLYELLTGRPPFDQKELLAAGLDEMRRTICEKEPLKPSTRLSTMAPDALTSTAQRRRTEAPELIDVVRRDLDWIVMKCLEKDRSRRYETVNGLTTDIGRYLRNEPVVARPPSRWYSLQKLARRNRATLIAAAIVILALVLAVVVLAFSNVRIRHEQAEKQTALATAQKSEREAREQLLVSLKSQAAARRQSRQIGQQIESLAALRKAGEIRRDTDLRDAAIAALAVPDLRPATTWQAHSTNDVCIAFDPNYERYALIDNQSVISVRTLAEGREILRFASGPAPQRYGIERVFSFSPDGRLLAKFEVDNRWSVWRVENGKLVFRTPPASGYGLAITSDSTEMAIPLEDTIVIFDVLSGVERKRFGFKHRADALAFSPSNRYLAAGSVQSEVVSVFDLEKEQLFCEFRAGSSPDRALAWHPSGKYLAVSANQQIQLWNVEAAAMVSKLEGHAQTVTTLSFDPDGNWLTADSWDGTPRLWQPSPCREWLRFFSGLNNLRFSKDGRWAGVLFPGGGKAQLLEFIPSRVYHTFFGSLTDSRNSFPHTAISPDGRLLVLPSAGGVSIRELPNGRELAVLPVGVTWIARFHPNGQELLISGTDFQVWSIVRQTNASNEIRVALSRRIPLFHVAHDFCLARDGRTMAVTDNKSGVARIVDLVTGTLRDVQFPHEDIDCVTLTPDACWLATSGWHSPQTQLWNAQTGERLLNVTGERARVDFTPDGRELVVCTSQAYVFYDVRTQKETRRFERQGSMHLSWIAYSPDGKMMAMELSPGVIRLCELATGRTIANLQDPNGNVSRFMVFNDDGTQLIVAAPYERAIHRWDFRAMRVELKAIALDWDWPAFPPPSDGAQNPRALEVEVVSDPVH